MYKKELTSDQIRVYVLVSIYKYAKIFIKAGFSVNFLSSNI